MALTSILIIFIITIGTYTVSQQVMPSNTTQTTTRYMHPDSEVVEMSTGSIYSRDNFVTQEAPSTSLSDLVQATIGLNTSFRHFWTSMTTSFPTPLALSRLPSPNDSTSSPLKHSTDNSSMWWLPYIEKASQLTKCPLLCQCHTVTLYDLKALLFFTKLNESTRPTFEDFRGKILPVFLEKIYGAQRLLHYLTTYTMHVKCFIQARALTIDRVFEEHFSEFPRSLFNISLTCLDNFPVIWNSSNIRIRTFSVQDCLHVTVLKIPNTPDGLTQLFIVNSSSSLLESFRSSNSTQNISTVEIRDTLVTKILPVFPEQNLTLESLTLINNSMKLVDCKGLESISGMKYITITDNSLTVLPECLLSESLEYFNLSRNFIYNLSILEYPRFVPSQNLLILDLCYNNISYLNTFTFLDIGVLHICHNSIRTIPRLTFLQVAGLMVLDLHGNQISNIENGAFGFLYHLQFLDLSYNNILSIDIEATPSVACHININDNRLTHPPFTSTKYRVSSAIQVLAVNNPYYCDCKLTDYQNFIANGQNKEFYDASKRNWPISFFQGRTYPDRLFTTRNFTCGFPERLRGQGLLDVVFNGSCPVVKDCPNTCVCDNRLTVIFVNCVQSNLTSIPLVMPAGTLELDFRHNRISYLPFRDYLSRTSYLNMRHNILVQVSAKVFEAITSTKFIDLRNNRLKELPNNLSGVDLHEDILLGLTGNPWLCNCDNLWLSRWLTEKRNIFLDDGNLTCASPAKLKGHLLYQLTDNILHCQTPSFLSLVISLSIFCTVLIILIPVLYKFRLTAKALIYAKLNARPFDKNQSDQCKNYDAFIAYSAQNERWVFDALLPYLEGHQPAYKLCIHHRDFLVGESIAENITHSVENSQATILVISQSFVTSEWCLFEFQKAHHEMLQRGDCRLVAILLEDIKYSEVPSDLATYLKANTYVTVGDRWFWEKLLYALPVPGRPTRLDAEDQSTETML